MCRVFKLSDPVGVPSCHNEGETRYGRRQSVVLRMGVDSPSERGP